MRTQEFVAGEERAPRHKIIFKNRKQAVTGRCRRVSYRSILPLKFKDTYISPGRTGSLEFSTQNFERGRREKVVRIEEREIVTLGSFRTRISGSWKATILLTQISDARIGQIWRNHLSGIILRAVIHYDDFKSLECLSKDGVN